VVANVRYGSGDNSVLRYVLHELWSSRCYRCHHPKDFNDIQIDHIIPRHVGPERLRELGRLYGLPRDFDVDSPANLAPICSVCNGPRGKGKKEYRARLLEQDQLDRAIALEPRVVERVLGFGRSGKLAEHLLQASQADLSDPKARQAFEEHAPAVVQKLALLGAGKVNFTTLSTELVQSGHGSTLEVSVSLDNSGREAELILNDVCRCPTRDVLRGPVTSLASKIRERTRVAFARSDGPAGPIVSGPPEIQFIWVDIDSISYMRSWREIEFTFYGSFEADLSASLVQDNLDGVGLDEVQGDAQVYGRFSFGATCEFSGDPGNIDVHECWIEWWKDDIELHNNSA
jgi:hypothetical protein